MTSADITIHDQTAATIDFATLFVSLELSLAKWLATSLSTEPKFAGFLWLEGFYRRFNNRRQLPAHAGFAPSPWRSGKINRDKKIM
ncbi:MAG: hypothetical protein ACR2RF_30280 [Geminicoccaceae bacterium]